MRAREIDITNLCARVKDLKPGGTLWVTIKSIDFVHGNVTIETKDGTDIEMELDELIFEVMENE